MRISKKIPGWIIISILVFFNDILKYLGVILIKNQKIRAININFFYMFRKLINSLSGGVRIIKEYG